MVDSSHPFFLAGPVYLPNVCEAFRPASLIETPIIRESQVECTVMCGTNRSYSRKFVNKSLNEAIDCNCHKAGCTTCNALGRYQRI